MSSVDYGFREQNLLVQFGPALRVRIGFDPNCSPNGALLPNLPEKLWPALVDAVTSESSIDSKDRPSRDVACQLLFHKRCCLLSSLQFLGRIMMSVFWFQGIDIFAQNQVYYSCELSQKLENGIANTQEREENRPATGILFFEVTKSVINVKG